MADSQYREALYLCYLDDALIWVRDCKEHINCLPVVLYKIKTVAVVLSPLYKIKTAAVVLPPSHSILEDRQVEYLGYVIQAAEVKFNVRVEQIQKLKRPRTVMELRKAFEAFAHEQKWIPGMAKIAKPLCGAFENNGIQKLTWTEEMNEIFTILKDRATNSIALNIADFYKKFDMLTYASNVATEAMLANREDNQLTSQQKTSSFVSP